MTQIFEFGWNHGKNYLGFSDCRRQKILVDATCARALRARVANLSRTTRKAAAAAAERDEEEKE